MYKIIISYEIKAMKALGFIKRNCHPFNSPSIFKILSRSLTRPNLNIVL